MAAGAIAPDILDREEHETDSIPGSLHLSRGKLEMNVEEMIPDLDALILCFCNAFNRGALSADTLRLMGYRNARFIGGGLKAYRARTEQVRTADPISGPRPHANSLTNRASWSTCAMLVLMPPVQ